MEGHSYVHAGYGLGHSGWHGTAEINISMPTTWNDLVYITAHEMGPGFGLSHTYCRNQEDCTALAIDILFGEGFKSVMSGSSNQNNKPQSISFDEAKWLNHHRAFNDFAYADEVKSLDYKLIRGDVDVGVESLKVEIQLPKSVREHILDCEYARLSEPSPYGGYRVLDVS